MIIDEAFPFCNFSYSLWHANRPSFFFCCIFTIFQGLIILYLLLLLIILYLLLIIFYLLLFHNKTPTAPNHPWPYFISILHINTDVSLHENNLNRSVCRLLSHLVLILSLLYFNSKTGQNFDKQTKTKQSRYKIFAFKSTVL